MMPSKKLKQLSTLILISLLAIGFQNCENVEPQEESASSGSNGNGNNNNGNNPTTPGATFKITEFVYHQNIKIDANFSQNMTSIDLDADGDLDLILTESTKNKLTLVLNDGSGNFTISQSLPATSRVYSRVLTDDFNNDGKYDLAAAAKGGVLHIWLNDGSNNFPNRLDYQTSSANSGEVQFISSGDINNDGYVDIAVANTSNDVSGYVTILTNDQSGEMEASQIKLGHGLEPYGVVLTDLNNDSYSDLVFTSKFDDKVYVYENSLGSLSLNSSFAGSSDPSSSALTDVLSTDLDNDGSLDLVWGSECLLGKLECHKDSYDQQVYVAYGEGDLSFDTTDALLTEAYGDVRSLGLVDINKDGKIDIVSIDDIPFATLGGYSSISFFMNKGSNRSFKKVQNKMLARETDDNDVETTPGSFYSNSFAFGDFNNDGLIDFAADAKINASKPSSGTRVYFGKKKKNDEVDTPF